MSMSEIIQLTATNAVLKAADGATMPVLTSGMQGHVKVQFTFSEAWGGLNKAAVFRVCNHSYSVLEEEWEDGNVVTIPSEVFKHSGYVLNVGVYGYSVSPDVVELPTIWCVIGEVQPGTDPNAETPGQPTPQIWEQIKHDIGDLSGLETEDKENLVSAINEARRGGSLYVEYGKFNDWSKISEAVEEKKPVFCFKFDSNSYVTILYRLVYAISDQYIFTCEYNSAIDFVYANKEGNGITWTDERLPFVRKHLPETEGNAYFTANGSHYGSAKYVGILFDNSDVADADKPALASNVEDPRIKLHGGSRNVDIMASIAEDGKNAVEILGDNKKNNTYLGGILAPRANKPNDAANKGYVDSRIIPFTVTLAYDAWETVEGETEEDTTYTQTVEVPALHNIYSNENANVTLCPSPSNVAAWTNYGMICTDVTAGNGESNGSFTFLSKTHPSANENITLNMVLLR